MQRNWFQFVLKKWNYNQITLSISHGNISFEIVYNLDHDSVAIG